MIIQIGLSINSYSGFANFIIAFLVWGLNNTDVTITTSDTALMYAQVYAYGVAQAAYNTAVAGSDTTGEATATTQMNTAV